MVEDPEKWMASLQITNLAPIFGIPQILMNSVLHTIPKQFMWQSPQPSLLLVEVIGEPAPGVLHGLTEIVVAVEVAVEVAVASSSKQPAASSQQPAAAASSKKQQNYRASSCRRQLVGSVVIVRVVVAVLMLSRGVLSAPTLQAQILRPAYHVLTPQRSNSMSPIYTHQNTYTP